MDEKSVQLGGLDHALYEETVQLDESVQLGGLDHALYEETVQLGGLGHALCEEETVQLDEKSVRLGGLGYALYEEETVPLDWIPCEGGAALQHAPSPQQVERMQLWTSSCGFLSFQDLWTHWNLNLMKDIFSFSVFCLSYLSSCGGKQCKVHLKGNGIRDTPQ